MFAAQVDMNCTAVRMQLPASDSQGEAPTEFLALGAGRCILGCHFNITWVCPHSAFLTRCS